ncbi:MAG: elongation factor G [Acidobacteriota bacterium]
MKVYSTEKLRNVAFVGHGDSGKTSLVASALYVAGATEQLGNVDEGTAPTDFDQEEINRKVSMSCAAAFAEWRDHKINLIDAPGYTNFIGEAAAALHAADIAAIVVHGVDGPGVQTEKMWADAEKAGKPVAFVVSQLDRERADFDEVLGQLQQTYGRTVLPVTLPLGEGADLDGVASLITGKAYRPKAGSRDVEEGDLPGDLADRIAEARETLLEMVAESDDELMNAFLEEGGLTEEQFLAGLRTAMRQRTVIPVFAAAAPRLVGVRTLLDALVDFAPSPAEMPPVTVTLPDGSQEQRPISDDAPLALQVFKTYIDPFAGQISLFKVFGGKVTADQQAFNATTETQEKLSGLACPRGKSGEKVSELHAGDIGLVVKLKNTRTGDTIVADKGHVVHLPPIPFPRPVIAYAVHAGADDDKVAAALQKLAMEDPTLSLDRDRRTHELMLGGLGIDHVRTVMDKLKNRFNLEATLQKPKIPYLETITRKASTSYRHKKQTGGAGQFAEVHMRVEPLPRGAGFEYDSEIVGGAISRNFWPSIEKGVRQVMESGVIAGFPMVDIKAVIFDGKEHPVDSKDVAFQIAGRQVFKKCVMEAGPVILEPIMKMVVTCPDDCLGDILGDLSRRRGKVQGSDSAGGKTVVRALVPMAEVLEYSATLKSLTQDRGSYTMELDHYDRVPAEIQAELIAQHQPEESED